MLHKLFTYFLIAFLFFAFCKCGQKKDTSAEKTNVNILQGLEKDATIKYAKRFAISENKFCRIAYLFGNVDIRDTTAAYIFLKDSTIRLHSLKHTFIFKSPCKKIASLSSVYTTMLCSLNETDHIVAIDNVEYYNNAFIINKHNKNQLAELSKNPEIDLEKTIALNPDIVFSFGMGTSEKVPNEKINRAKIPMVIAVDHLEETPLARAEWIKFFAAFVNKTNMADSIFNHVEKNYLELKTIASAAKTKPEVFTEIKYGDIWYVPGGKSFVAKFFSDANVNYIWRNDSKNGSLHLGFEEVYSKAKDADFWLNLSLLNSKKELYSLDKRYSEFKAYKTGNIYNNNKVANKNGYSTYWETGIMYPDKVLSDLILIFHSELKAHISSDLNYYKKLE
jgi:iron complex transport system substrate-binding protein